MAIKNILKSPDLFKALTFLLFLVTVGLGFQNYTGNKIISEQNNLIDSLNTSVKQVDKIITGLHFFSNSVKKDTFKIKMHGLDIISSDIDFEIISQTGEIVFSHQFKATDLIGYGLIDIENPTDIEKENYILKRFYNFLDESNFSKPAISRDEKLDDEFYNSEYIDEIKEQKDCYSFYYLLGEEYSRRIVYLRKDKKTIEFWSCC